jgi:hypothetical protein
MQENGLDNDAVCAFMGKKCGLVDDLSAGPKAFCALTNAVAIFFIISPIK